MSRTRSSTPSWRHTLVAISLSTAVLVGAAPPVDAVGSRGTVTLVARPGERMIAYAGLAVAWPGTRVQVRSGHVVRGLVAEPVPASTATLQRLVLGEWADVISTPVPRSGSFVMPLPAFYYGHFSYRLRVTAADADPVETPALPVAVVPSYTPRGRATGYTLINSNPVGRWDPCTPIGYRVNVAKAPKGALRDVRTALARIAHATGLQFDYLGATDVVPFAIDGPFDPAVADLVVAWAAPHQAPGLFPPGTYAQGGPELRGGAHDVAGNPVRQIYQGGVTFNTAFNSVLEPRAGSGFTRVRALMHELGHAVGLFHVTGDPAEIMSPSLSRGRAEWGAGDLAGLEAVGAVNGCVTAE